MKYSTVKQNEVNSMYYRYSRVIGTGNLKRFSKLKRKMVGIFITCELTVRF